MSYFHFRKNSRLASTQRVTPHARRLALFKVVSSYESSDEDANSITDARTTIEQSPNQKEHNLIESDKEAAESFVNKTTERKAACTSVMNTSLAQDWYFRSPVWTVSTFRDLKLPETFEARLECFACTSTSAKLPPLQEASHFSSVEFVL
jgi:hypothetical protein